MEEIKELMETLEKLTDDMLSRILVISESENNMKLTLDKITIFKTLVNDLSIFYECALVINQYKDLNSIIPRINNVLNYIYVNYDTDLFLTFEIITVDFRTILLEMKGTLHQCIH